VTSPLDVTAIREHFSFPERHRVVTNNAASTQPFTAAVDLYRELAPGYENVHRGQSRASVEMTALFEGAWCDIADFIGSPGPESLALYRGTTEAVNAVMYMLMTELRNGDNVVGTLMEHNSNYVPWHALCREILPRLGVQVELRLARFDALTGRLDLDHLASLVDERTKLVCCTGASNFLGTKVPLAEVRAIADASGYRQPSGEEGSLLLIDAAQLTPSGPVHVGDLGVDFLAFSFHKMFAPFGVGVLYAREPLLLDGLPFLYGGDMVAERGVFADRVEYNRLPWKYAAGTPNILGTIASAEALRLLLDVTHEGGADPWSRTRRRITAQDAVAGMTRVSAHGRLLTQRALGRLATLPTATVYGPAEASERVALIAFNLKGQDPFAVSIRLAEAGVEARAGCHCATLAHRHLGLDPLASVRLSFTIYNSTDDVDRALDAVCRIAGQN
jgi:cysteine desulfurase/selenocysteine lyase